MLQQNETPEEYQSAIFYHKKIPHLKNQSFYGIICSINACHAKQFKHLKKSNRGQICGQNFSDQSTQRPSRLFLHLIKNIIKKIEYKLLSELWMHRFLDIACR